MHLTPPPIWPSMPNFEGMAAIAGIPVALMVLIALCVVFARWLSEQHWFPHQVGLVRSDDFVSLFVVLQALPPAVIEGEAIEKPAAQAAIR